MKDSYIVKAGKIVTVSDNGTIYDGAMVVSKGKIIEIGKWKDIKDAYSELKVIDYKDYVITPSLVDCHTHILEYAPGSIYPVTENTHLMGGMSLLLHTLSCGVTALGEQICGHPQCDIKLEEYKDNISNLPIHVLFSVNSISIGFNPIVHFTSVTGSKSVEVKMLTNRNVLEQMSELTEYPGENIFINATPANLKEDKVPRAGDIIYTLDELKDIVKLFHSKARKIGAHVAGEEGIEMALESGFDILHHAHGISRDLMQRAHKQNVMVVATPIGGTHLVPNSPEEVVQLMKNKITTAVATDSYLPPSNKATWLEFKDDELKGPEVLMKLANPSMKILYDKGYDENEILALITLNGAKILGKENDFGSLKNGMEANFIVTKGIPGLEITEINDIKAVYFKGERVIKR
jgi:imidazolonepropionase-like amidohydrolase